MRADQGNGLRRISVAGYPQRAESPHDVVESSHASSSLSWADGISRAFTATGQLYDAFTLTRGADGRNRLTESDRSLLALRRCDGAAGPDDRPCTAEIKD